jgi:tricarballylate dehydrogenase
LHLSRTNAFFLGGGKALVNAYYRSAERLGIQIRYQSPVVGLECKGKRIVAALIGEPGAADRDDVSADWPVRERIEAKSIVIASGGFELISLADRGLGQGSS